MILSDTIIASARSYVGTPFKHQGRRKATPADKGGIDCLGLLVGVARECELRLNGVKLADQDARDYGHIPDYQRLHAGLCQWLTEIPKEEMRAGDVALFKLDHNPQHLAIIAGEAQHWSVIHAYAPARKVVEHRMDDGWCARIAHLYRFSDERDEA